MSRHFVVEIRVALPGENDDEEEKALNDLLVAIGNLPEYRALSASMEPPRQN